MIKVSLLFLLSSILTIGLCRGSILGDESPLQRRMASMRSGHASARMFGAERPSRAEEFNRTGVLQPEYQIRATLNPNDVSQFYYLSPKSGSPPTLLVSPCSGPISWSVSYVGPPETDQHTEGSKSNQQQTHWPVKQLVPSLPLFKYEGSETRNFTIPAATTNLYLIEMKPISAPDFLDVRTRSPNTVLMYATSDALDHLPSSLITPTRSKRHQPLLEFQQRWSRRRLIVSWNKNQIDPASSSSYLLAVTTSGHLHPPTLCAAENILKKHPCSSSERIRSVEAYHRPEPEGLHCVRRNKITLFGVKYNTTYYFTLYIMNTQNNVSSRVAMDSFKFERRLPFILQNGRYMSANLKKNDGFAVFRYRPRDNATTLFNILACGVCSVKLKIRAPGYCLEEQITGEFRLRAPSLPPGRRFSIQISATQTDLLKSSKVKIIAIDDEAVPYTDYMLQNSATSGMGMSNVPWEYRMLRKCRKKSASWCASTLNLQSLTPCDQRQIGGSTNSLVRPCTSSTA